MNLGKMELFLKYCCLVCHPWMNQSLIQKGLGTNRSSKNSLSAHLKKSLASFFVDMIIFHHALIQFTL